MGPVRIMPWLGLWWRLPGIPTGIALLLACGFALSVSGGEESPALSGKPTSTYQPDGDTNPTNGLGAWIWDDKTFDRQTCQFWRSFDIPAHSTVVHARLLMTVDNDYTLLLDGRELGRGAEWRELFDYDVRRLLSPGKHILAVKAYNSATHAGMLFGLRVDFEDGRVLEVKSDGNWRVVPAGTRGWETRSKAAENWPAARIIAPLGAPPWWQVPQNVNMMPTLEPIEVHFWQAGWFQVVLLLVCALVILISLRMAAQLALHRRERWLLQKERARIPMDSPGDLGSRMTRLVLQGEVMQSELPANSETRAQLEGICEQARGMLSTLDEILWAVNPKRDKFRDFTSYACGYTQEFLKTTNIQCYFDIDPAVTDVVLNLPLKRALLMVMKEALNNVVKHSEATELVLQIKWHAQKLRIVIADNGKGFDQATLKLGRNGLTNMSQRMSEIGGTCVLANQDGKGCRVEFTIPLEQPRFALWRWSRKQARNSELGSQPAELKSEKN